MSSLFNLFHHLYTDLELRPGDVAVPGALQDAFEEWVKSEIDDGRMPK